MYPLAAGGYQFRPLKLTQPRTMGWDVWALQACLLIPADGIFGPQTDEAVRGFQRRDAELQREEIDGIAGTHTQKRIAYSLIWEPQRRFDTPPGLVRGFLEGESAFILGNYTRPYANSTRDVGLTMLNIAITSANLQFAFAGPVRVSDLAQRLRVDKDQAFAKAHSQTDGHLRYPQSQCLTHIGAWKYGSILRWNWPSASAVYVEGRVGSWTYVARFIPGQGEDEGALVQRNSDGSETRAYRMADDAQWIKRIGVAGVDTGYEWAEFYIATKAHYADLEHP